LDTTVTSMLYLQRVEHYDMIRNYEYLKMNTGFES